MLEESLGQVLLRAYNGTPKVPPRGGPLFVEMCLEVMLARAVIKRAKDPLENEPLMREPTALQRRICAEVAEYYLAVNPTHVDRERCAQNAGRIIASQLTQQVVDDAVREAAEMYQYPEHERRSWAVETRRRERHKPKPRAIYPV